jgi:hypothetical protein
MEDHFVISIKKQIIKDLSYIKKFCKEKNIPSSIDSFLSYKEKGIIPSCIYFFMGRDYSKFLFFNSKKWNDFFLSLPKDFQNDIASLAEIRKIKLLSISDKHIEQFLYNILKEDFYGGTK